MFFDSPTEIEKIAAKVGTAIFVVPDTVKVQIKNALVLTPEDKTTITIEQVRDVLARLAVRQTHEQFILIHPAEALGDEAANAMLKNLEEPGDKVHFVLLTSSPSFLLKTITSRAALYILRMPSLIDSELSADAKVKDLAKKIMVARPADLPQIAEEITKKKDGVRNYALTVVGTAIEMLYKSYYITGKDVFVKKLPAFIECYENISKNGHIKLHLVADLMG